MSKSTRFSVAIHILVALALRKERLSSEDLAWSIATNPSMVRRILSSLSRAGLVVSETGPAGGTEIAKDPRQITLLEVLDAVALRPSSGVHRPNAACPLGAVLDEPLRSVLGEAEQASDRVYARKTVYQVAQMARRRISRRARR